MKTRSYKRPSVRVVGLKYRVALLGASIPNANSVNGMYNNVGVGYADEGIEDEDGDM